MKEDNSRDPGEKWGTQWTSKADAAATQARVEQRAAEKAAFNTPTRWTDAKPTKMILLWCCIGAAALSIFVGFQWGGWKTAKGAETQATTASSAAIVEQLAPICVAQFNLDPERDAKLLLLQETATYQQAAYVSEQQWATMPGADKPVTKVADACARLILGTSE